MSITAPQLTSIVMVTYYTGEALDYAIEAVLAQTADVELILVNNGNPPDVEAALVARFKDEPLVRLLTGHGNIGYARGCNLGARMAQGDRLLFLGPDCLLPMEAIAHLYRQEALLSRPFMIGVRQLDEEGAELRGSRRALLTPQTAFVESLFPATYLKKQRLNRHGQPLPKGLSFAAAINRAFIYIPKADFFPQGFDERYFLDGVDYDFSLNFRLRGGKIFFDPVCEVVRLGTPRTVSLRAREVMAARGISRYFHKNYRAAFGSTFLLLALDAALWIRCGVRIVLMRPSCAR